jgi:hypothetical protein
VAEEMKGLIGGEETLDVRAARALLEKLGRR